MITRSVSNKIEPDIRKKRAWEYEIPLNTVTKKCA